ncbi:LuxR C-terminal-related transcriptional regulator [Paenibacillus oleatilyticus]|uniref:LuxR C-terminal-related transcriptional regulator n=1 Tax=Paenibacillus oleatilyticus TaxID=2594886 RepID=UPI001C1FF0DC|nr:LuxR C-terminal-related transcriptional regulator [Paenibacillus oleatilyticus]MBU7315608.1 LuxR C-terminal-related transcriptional regulator [Paenibacillus oleatilyticus]
METKRTEQASAFQTIGERLERWHADDFVGRAFELGVFEQYVTQLASRQERIINVYGTGGMGKTQLLERFRRSAADHGACYLGIDMRDYLNNPAAVCGHLLLELGASFNPEEPALLEQCLERIRHKAEETRIILGVDHYEEAGSLDRWFRETFIPGLHSNILLVIAGRFPLAGSWQLSSAWQKLIVPLPLSELSYEETQAWLLQNGITDEKLQEAVWMRTFGHPLSLSLFGPIARADSSPLPKAGDPLEDLLRQWLREAPDDELRRLTLTASVPRTFNQELLTLLEERDVPFSLFDRLIRLSFVRRCSGGWQMHDLVRETIRRTFRERMPQTFEQYGQKLVETYYSRIVRAIPFKQDVSWEIAEMIPHTDNPVLRAHFRHAPGSGNYLETIDAHNLNDAENYIDRRKREARSWKIACSDPESDTLFRFTMTAEQTLYRLTALDLPRMLRLGCELRLLRSPEGRVVGLMASVPIHERTLDFLAQSPISGTYFASLPPGERARYRTPPEQASGAFLLTIDVENLEKEELRSDVIRLLFESMMAGKVLLTSPPPLDYYELAYRSLGFETVPGAEHRGYDGRTPTPTYRVDTSKEKLPAFLGRLIRSAGKAAPSPPGPTAGEAFDFTPREREVADLLVRGDTNAQIAAALFISEVAVKKHVNAMLQKTGLKNRTQLAAKIWDGRNG